jgi:hypothetical protein
MTDTMTRLAQAHPGPIIIPRGLLESIDVPLETFPEEADFAVGDMGSGNARPPGPSFLFHVRGDEVHAIVWQSLVAEDWTGLYHPCVHFRALRRVADRLLSKEHSPVADLSLVAVDDEHLPETDYTLKLALVGNAEMTASALVWHVEAVVEYLWSEVDDMLANKKTADRLYLEVFGRKPFAEPTRSCWHAVGEAQPIVAAASPVAAASNSN